MRGGKDSLSPAQPCTAVYITMMNMYQFKCEPSLIEMNNYNHHLICCRVVYFKINVNMRGGKDSLSPAQLLNMMMHKFIIGNYLTHCSSSTSTIHKVKSSKYYTAVKFNIGNYVVNLGFLLIQAGDVEENPGPGSNDKTSKNPPTQIPPRNTHIKFKMKNQNDYISAKTSQSQPKSKSKNKGYVNIEELDKDPYSINWLNVEKWEIIPQEIEPNQETPNSHNQDSQFLNQNPLNNSRLSNYRTPAKESSSSTSEDETYKKYYEELPPYQIKDKSQISSVSTSTLVDSESQDSYEDKMSEQMSQLDISNQSHEKKSRRKRTPMKEKIQKLKEELGDKQEKIEELEEIITKITSEDGETIRKELADTLKTLNIYKDEVRKRMAKGNEALSANTEYEVHPKARTLIHKQKSEILTINSNLNKLIDKLETEVESLRKSNEELASQLEKEKEVHMQYDILQLQMFNLDDATPEKIAFDAEQNLQKKKTEIDKLNRNIDEINYQLNEKTKEIHKLKQTNSELYNENFHMKTIQEKDKTIQIKNDNYISLLEEKLNNCKKEFEKYSTGTNHTEISSKNFNPEPRSPQGEVATQFRTRQGLPNEKNFCFIIAVMHALATCLPKGKLNEDHPLLRLVKDTKSCIAGNKTAEEAQTIINEIWEYTKAKWPNYENQEGQTTQECAAEYLRRVIECEEQLKQETEIYAKKVKKCYNNNCTMLASEEKSCSNIIKAEINDKIEITLQEIINDFQNEKDEAPCHICLENSKITQEIRKSPQMLIIEIPRATHLEEKNTITVKDTRNRVHMMENNEKVEYRTTSVIVHKGDFSLNGHYILNYFNPFNKRWERIDDDEVTVANHLEEENEQGVIYILEKIKQNMNPEEIPNSYKSIPREPSSYAQMAEKHSREYNKKRNNMNLRSIPTSMKPNQSTQNNYLKSNENEYENIRRRKNNIIIKGLQERSIESDISKLIQINRDIGNETFNKHNIIQISRIGEKQNGPRPLKVVLDSYHTKIQIMRNAKRLQYHEEYHSISIQHDLTINQMNQYKEMVQKSIEEEEKDLERCQYRVRGPPGQWKIVRYSKNSQH